MKEVKLLLDSIKEFYQERFETEKAFAEELDRIITQKYDGNYTKFMNEILFSDDYISIRFEVERMLGKPLF